MTPDTFDDALQAFGRRRPFRPFQIEFHSGRRLVVTHPEAVRGRGGLLHFVSPGEDRLNYVFDASSVSLLSDLEP
jgi:hypothetical protein